MAASRTLTRWTLGRQRIAVALALALVAHARFTIAAAGATSARAEADTDRAAPVSYVTLAAAGAPVLPPVTVPIGHRVHATLLTGPRAEALCDNPYSATTCAVDAIVQCAVAARMSAEQPAATTRKTMRFPAFYEPPTPTQSASFEARFLIADASDCTVTVELAHKASEALPHTAAIRYASFKLPHDRDAARSGLGGIAAVAPNKQYFVDSSTGDLLFPVGPNLAWPGGTNSTKPFYSQALPALAAASATYVRLWFGPSQVGGQPFSDIQLQTSLGKVDPGAASRVDWLLQEAESNGIRGLVALDSYNALCTDTKYFCNWDGSVYNSKNGGPCDNPDDFWTSADAYAGFQSYARYVVARWGASPAVFAWQMWNEMDGAIGGTSPEATSYLSNITAYIADIDTHKHLISNSYAQQSGSPAGDQLPHVSFSTTHAYESGDLGGTLSHYAAIKAGYSKPTYSGEFGRNANPYLKRIILHNGMWGTMAQLGAASGACWYWATVFGDHLLDEFTAISTFVKPLPLHKYSWEIVGPQGVASGARVLAQASAPHWDYIIGYVQSLKHIFGNNPPYPTVQPFTFLLPGCPNGDVDGGGDSDSKSAASATVTRSLQWFNTSTGQELGAPSQVSCAGGALSITTPAMSTDRAFVVTSSGAAARRND